MSGIHHVTAIAGNRLRNFDFYTRALGMRFVKKTVNFDDPGTYHFYYGDEIGKPGTILTFFPGSMRPPAAAASARPSRPRSGSRRRSLGYWTHRFIDEGRRPRGAREALRRSRAAPSPIRTACASRWSALPARRTSPPGAMATSRPSMRSAASMA